jgi:hypothetical protein
MTDTTKERIEEIPASKIDAIREEAHQLAINVYNHGAADLRRELTDSPRYGVEG